MKRLNRIANIDRRIEELMEKQRIAEEVIQPEMEQKLAEYKRQEHSLR